MSLFLHSRCHRTRPLILIAVGLLSLCSTTHAFAKKRSRGEERGCSSAYQSAQELERKGQLRRAKDTYRTCAKETCSSLVQHECTDRFTRLNSDIPSIIAVVTDASGEAVLDVQVSMDGERLCTQLDGRGLPVDPGLHEFLFEGKDGARTTEKILIVQGQRNRTISIALPSTSGVVSAPRSKKKEAPTVPLVTPAVGTVMENDGPSALTYVFGGVGLASLGAGALFTYWGRKDNRALSECSPMCKPESVAHVKKLYVGADLAIGGGITALALSFLIYTVTSGGDTPVPSVGVSVAPTPSGAAASVSGRF